MARANKPPSKPPDPVAFNPAVQSTVEREIKLAIDPNFGPAHYNRANTLHEQGRLEEALAGYDRVIALAPRAPDAHVARAYALEGLKRLDEALAAADQAAAVAPELPRAHKARAAMLAALGRPEEARTASETAAELEQKAAKKAEAANPA